MNKVPKMISTKDFMYISDMLNHNFYVCKKGNQFVQDVQDKDVEKVLKDAIKVLKDNYSTLLDLLSI